MAVLTRLPVYDWDHMRGWGGWGWGWMWLVGLLLLLAVIAAVVVAVVALTRGTGGRTSAGGPAGRSTARDILAERYARGELSTEEYRERLRELG